jgi:chorismate mutase
MPRGNDKGVKIDAARPTVWAELLADGVLFSEVDTLSELGARRVVVTNDWQALFEFARSLEKRNYTVRFLGRAKDRANIQRLERVAMLMNEIYEELSKTGLPRAKAIATIFEDSADTDNPTALDCVNDLLCGLLEIEERSASNRKAWMEAAREAEPATVVGDDEDAMADVYAEQMPF